MKRLLILALFIIAIAMPVTAFSWNISGGSGWSVSAYPADAGKMGDGDTGTNWYNAGYGNFTEFTWSPSNYYSKVRLYPASASNEYWAVNDVCTQILGSTWQNLSVSPGDAITMRFYAGDSSCITDNPWGKIAEIQWENGTPPAPIANFTGNPLNASAPAYVVFTDNSENKYGVCTYNWSITPTAGILAGATGILMDHSASFSASGNYTVSHSITCPAGSNTSTKTDYIHIYNSTALITTAFRATDGVSGNRITGATIHLQDIENASWSNSSTVNGAATISVLSGHHINAYATATGFSDGEYLNAPAMAWTYDIMMLPTGFANVSAGNVTAYITVTDGDTLQKLYYAFVRAAYATSGGTTSLESQTNSAGVASFVLPNNTNVHFSANKEGYEGGNLVLNTGTGSGGDAHIEGEIKIYHGTVTPTITATTLPGGGTPAPTLTYLANCNPSASDYDAAKCRASHGNSGLNILAENLDILVWICIIVTIMYLLGIRLGG